MRTLSRERSTFLGRLAMPRPCRPLPLASCAMLYRLVWSSSENPVILTYTEPHGLKVAHPNPMDAVLGRVMTTYQTQLSLLYLNLNLNKGLIPMAHAAGDSRIACGSDWVLQAHLVLTR